MDEMKRFVTRVRDTLTKQLEDLSASKRLYPDFGAQVREQALRLLRRKDLRIITEVLLHDMRNLFSGFETLDINNRRLVIEDALRIIESLDALIASEQMLNPDRIELPPPPPSMAAIVQEKERVIRQEERRQKERIQAERNKQRLSRHTASRPPVKKPVPPPEPPPKREKDRSSLVFESDEELLKPSVQPQGEWRGGRGQHQGNRPPRPPEPGKPNIEPGKDRPGGDQRDNRRGRRRPHRR